MPVPGTTSAADITGKRRKILFLVTEDWYFLSHRLCLAQACRDRGWDVVVATQVNNGREAIEREGLRIAPITVRRGGKNPLTELRTLLQIARIYRRERPDIVHHVALKPVIYGSLAAMAAGRPVVINAVAGMGYAFSADSLSSKIVRWLVQGLLRFCLRGRKNWLILQNRDDARTMTEGHLIEPDRLTVIPGSGVDPERFKPAPEPEGDVVIAVVCRMIREKGIYEAVDALRDLKNRGARTRLWLVGDPDTENPSGVSPEILRRWDREGTVEWLGHQSDIAAIWARAHIAALPTYYREGIPKSLIEAAACGRPIVTTDMPGCRDLVTDGENGLLVPPRDAAALADALERLIDSPETRRRMGAAGREAVERLYTEEKVVQATLDLYDRALAEAEQ